MLSTLPYHQRVIDHFRQQQKTWDYFAGAKTKADQLQEFKLELLKNTYKFDPQAEPLLYEKVSIVKEKLDLQQLPVTIYQSQYTDELNASIAYLENEAHIVLSGPILRLLDDEEILAVLAHELSHIKLYTLHGGDVEIASRIVGAIANAYNSDAAYVETARLFSLYTEIFCDRSTFKVVDRIEPIITSLVKISTGLDKVNGDAFLKQADEILNSNTATKTAALSHPENFIRAKAMQLWFEKKEEAEEEIARMIEGTMELDQLDIFRQREIARLTRRFLQLYLKPKWFQTTLTISLAKQYFPDFAWDDTVLLDGKLVEKIADAHPSIRDYLSYVLFDFVQADPALEAIPAGWSFQFAEDMKLAECYEAIVKKEMKLSEKKLQQHRDKSLAAYYGVKENEGEQIYED